MKPARSAVARARFTGLVRTCSISGPESTWKGTRDSGGTDYVGKYAGVFGSKFLLNGLVARHDESDKFNGPGRDVPLSIDATVTPNANSGLHA